MDARPVPPRTTTTLFLLLAAACSDSSPDAAGGTDAATNTADPASAPAPDTSVAERPATATDTILLEGLPEAVPLRLIRSPGGFPLPFTAYVPTAMDPEFSTAGDGATLDIVAEFGGRRNDDAFLHLYVFPEGTSRQAAEAAALAYRAGRGIPVSRGLEPLAAPRDRTSMPWALDAYRFRYQSGGQWLVGRMGVGHRSERYFLLVRHYPEEYAEGFAPRADLVLQSWLWSDGSTLGGRPASRSR